MVGGAAALGITILVNEASGAFVPFRESDYAFSSETDGDTYIAVGLMYGSSITVGFEIKAPYGFVLGSTVINEYTRSFTPIYSIDSNIASVTVDSGLSKKSMTYYLTSNPDKTVIGGYHLELTNVADEYGMPLEYMVDEIASQLDDDSLYPIPAKINGENKIRLGDYATEADALAALQKYQSYFSDYSVAVAYPSTTAVSVVNPETDVILFEYDPADGGSSLGFTAYQGDEFDSYIQTPADNLYEGVMTFIPEYTDTATGVKLINLLDLESYVEGVLPYEISNSWSREVLRTFAITVRSYAIANYCKWYSKYGFDMTATTSDQVYRGRNRVNDAVVEAVASTEGLVAVHDGKIISAYYSSSVGGSTVGSQYVWGSARGYLGTVYTPWEKYTDYNNGLWYTEVTPEALCSTLRSKGYTELSGAIASIKVETVKDNPDYVYSLTFTDTSGHTVKLGRSDTVRTTLSNYLKSSNFTVGQGSLDRTYDKVYGVKIINESGVVITPDDEKEPAKVSGYVTNDQLLISDAYILTADGRVDKSEYPVSYLLTSTGRKVIMNSCVATANNSDDVTPFEYKNNTLTLIDPEDLPEDSYDDTDDTVETEGHEETEEEFNAYEVTDSIPVYLSAGTRDVISEFKNITVVTTLETVTETLYASSSNNFIFAGKGWGHGVGISQYGAKDLSDAGATAEDIISIYFTGVEIVPISELPGDVGSY